MKKGIAVSSVVAGCLSIALLLATTSVISPQAAAEYSVNFDEGSYSIWDGTTYTFDWYENPEIIDGVTVYTISNASDLAGFSILTNDITSSEFVGIANNVPLEYQNVRETFEGAEIRLNTDIDLGNFDWLPIAYPWNTANLSSRYEIHTPEGNTVYYNAVDHVPELETVDEWVGDENGNPISTRYWEYPESEMRFRDLIKPLTFEKFREIESKTFSSTIDNEDTFDKNEWIIPAFIDYEYRYLSHVIDNTYSMDNLARVVTPGDRNIYYVKGINYDNEIVQSYIYKDIAGYIETKGFQGTFKGNGYKIKNLHPSTPWTEDKMERLTTYDPLGKGLFGIVAEEGVIKDLAVKGSYNNSDIVSYSAILCAYNYGTIDNCYIDGQMQQGLINMYYPINRKYHSNHNSEYVLSSEAGTVLPVGNSGFITAMNYGRVLNCYTVGKVTQAYRQFGFVACTNKGIILNCENRATFETENITTDFITDEWSWSQSDNHANISLGQAYDITSPLGGAYIKGCNGYPYVGDSGSLCKIDSAYIADDNKSYASPGIYVTSSRQNEFMPLFYSTQHEYNTWLYNFDGQEFTSFPDLSSTMAYRCYSALGKEGRIVINTLSDGMWIPSLYDTEDYASIAANHLYGVYSETVVGGIAAINEGEINNCKNRGNIEEMGNTSPRNNFLMDSVGTREEYSYIRPNNSYGIFSTTINTENIAGGIVGLNKGKISNCKNEATINKRELSDIENNPYLMLFDTVNGYKKEERTVKLNYDFIPLTTNGFYVNGAYYIDEGGNKQINAFNTKWMIDDIVIEWIQDNLMNIMNSDIESLDDYGIYLTSSSHLERASNISYGLDIVEAMVEDALALIVSDYDRNMPYPYSIDQIAKVYQITGGIAGKNIKDIYFSEMTGSADNGITAVSKGVDEAATISMCNIDTQNLVKSNICDLAYDTNITGCDIRGIVSPEELQETKDFFDKNTQNIKLYHTNYIGGIANKYIQDKYTVSCEDCNVYKGTGAFLFATGNDYYLNNIVLYDNELQGSSYGFAQAIIGANMKNLVNFQESQRGIGLTENCVGDNIFIYNLCDYAFGNMFASDYVNLYALSESYEKGLINAIDTDIENLTALVMNTSSELGYAVKQAHNEDFVINMKNGELNNALIFTNFKHSAVKMTDMVVNNFSFYGNSDSFSNTLDYHTNYVYLFEGCDCTNMVLQSDIDVEFKNFTETRVLQDLPGVLKVYADSNKFDTCVIQTPDGVVSYSSKNILDMEDESIKTDASLVYDGKYARQSGALAYYLDHGQNENRTYNWTVATNDSYNIFDLMPECVNKELVTNIQEENRVLPIYTRQKVSVDEPSYYDFNIPYLSDGAGEIKGSIERDGILYVTKAKDEYYPKTHLYVMPGEEIKLDVEKTEGYDLEYMIRSVGNTSEQIKSDWASTEEYKHDKEIALDQDVQLIGIWRGINEIEVDADTKDWVDIQTSCQGAVKGRLIRVNAIVNVDASCIGRLYYCKYTKDANNLIQIDYTQEFEIPLDEMSFIMPDSGVCIFAERYGTGNEITRFRVNGVRGVIDNLTHTIRVELNDMIDLSSIVPEDIVVSEGATVSPTKDEPQDFRKPVIYTVTSQNGVVNTYTVIVTAAVDGNIQSAILNGVRGNINEETGEVEFLLDESVNIRALEPMITWKGISISPEGEQDFTNSVIYTVTSSDGSTKEYTFKVKFRDTTKMLQDIKLQADDIELSVVIDHDRKQVRVTGPYGTDFSRIFITDLVYNGDICNTETNTYINLTASYSIAVSDSLGNVYYYPIICIEDKSSIKRINQFIIYGIEGIIDEENHIITVDVPEKYDITNIAPDIVSFTGKTITDIYTKHDFSKEVEYTVTAYDDTTETYIIKVI